MSPPIDRNHPLICSGFICNISPSLSQLSYTIVGNALPGRVFFLFIFKVFFLSFPRGAEWFRSRTKPILGVLIQFLFSLFFQSLLVAATRTLSSYHQ